MADVLQVSKGEMIGKGSFGTTYLGKLDDQEVAVKCVRIEHEIEATTFLRELGALARIRHANIMTFLGMSLKIIQGRLLIFGFLTSFQTCPGSSSCPINTFTLHPWLLTTRT